VREIRNGSEIRMI